MDVNHSLELYPDYSISVALFDSVSNKLQLKEMLIQGKLDAALVNATMVPDVFPVLLAANKAVHLSENGKTKTRSIYSELVFNLSPSNNISESLKTFGLNDKDACLLVVVINKVGESNKTSCIHSLVEGEKIPLERLSSLADEKRIKTL
ncbi:EKC/KEOPS complex subunit TPRKB-like isoform X2 [Xenia sp. Carnegie-2017]|uniref:EKC/KEOPS complex subunit TPRKB-like isoform X2 n=1 Tax=Xenia sp. Carnegie-2017 TaxID=2897299 RepID=UPI001F0488EE|nr:EKC/KEOPS complex subunit TPRKB-like isoform X2 [Xenia sp. Carnegie-2017]